MTSTATQPKTFADAEKVLAKALPGYTPRPQQQALAAFVEEIIATDGHGLAEAGCGTGKSLATMIPAILGGKRTVVATATIALMEQYANKDVPFLQEHLGVDFTWALLKGRSNYLCRAKAAKATPAQVPNLRKMMDEVDADPTHTGDREHFSFPVDKAEFSWVSSTSNDCPGKSSCPFGDVCFAEAAKQKAARSQIIVTNTAMLMTDLKVKEMTDGLISMLGHVDLVLIDEGHETEEIATNSLHEEISPKGIELLVGEAVNFAGAQGVSLKNDGVVMAALRTAWKCLGDYPEEGSIPLRYFVENDEVFVGLIEALQALAEEMTTIKFTKGDKKVEHQHARILRKANNAADKIADICVTDDDLMVRWTEMKEGKGRNPEKTMVLVSAPVHVGSYLAEWLWDTTPSILISATLSVGGNFGYISERLGLPATTQSLSVGTPFDYSTQSMLFVPPKDAPSPKGNNPAYRTYATQAIQQLVSASEGGALLLFTSTAGMKAAYEGLEMWLEDRGITAYMQGQGSNKDLARKFEADEHSVLFALKSFFTGVDFQGDTCRLVVIDKLPFSVPTEPVFEARANQIKKFGGNDFADLTIPSMTLTLNQGFGRAIRTTQDRAVVAILDQRLNSGWGGRIIRDLPNAPRTSDINRVKEFYAAG